MGSGRFRKEERLCSERLIGRLYAEGHRLMVFPYSVQWCEAETGVPCQVMAVAPKRRFRHAVDRNRVKRLTRECWRVRKSGLCAYLCGRGVGIVVSLVYVHDEILSFQQLGKKMDRVLEALKADVEKHLSL